MNNKTYILFIITLFCVYSCSKDGATHDDDPDTEIEEKGITGFDPAVLKPGYPLKITGNNFPPATEELKVLFPVSEDGNRQSSNMKEGVILYRSSTEIEVVVPYNAGSGILELSSDNHNITGEIEVEPIVHEKIYYFAQGDFFTTGGYGLYSLSLQPNGHLKSEVENISQELHYEYDEISSMDYHPATDSFYGISYDRRFISITNNEWSIKCICPGACQFLSNISCPDREVITNTNNNKRYLLEGGRFANGEYGFMFREIDEQGTIIWSSNLLPPWHQPNLSFNAEKNEFITIVQSSLKTIVYRYDAETFEIKIDEAGEYEEFYDPRSPGSIFHFSNELSKLYVATRKHIFEVDLDNNTLININPGYPIDSFMNRLYRFIYYKPTNEFFVESQRANYGPVIHAVNRSSGETRWIGSGHTYLTTPHGPWKMRK